VELISQVYRRIAQSIHDQATADGVREHALMISCGLVAFDKRLFLAFRLCDAHPARVGVSLPAAFTWSCVAARVASSERTVVVSIPKLLGSAKRSNDARKPPGVRKSSGMNQA
jgi:hypothetical protein